MFDWQVNSEEQPLAHDAQEERAARDVRRWRLWGGLLLLLIMAGLFVFRWRLSERTQAMESDLKAFIRHEEQQRAFGLTEEADKLMVSDAPKEWQEAYRSMFVTEADNVQPVELEIEEIELNGTNAYVTVRLDDVPQVRFYRLVGQEWRRAPLSDAFWGQERPIQLANNQSVTIIYPAREEPFAQRLAADLPIFLQQWPSKQRYLIIKIKPTEFGSALLYVSQNDDTRQIVLNSPKLIVPEHVDGEGAVRLALANALLEEANLEYDTLHPSVLPGAATFLAAIRNTFILRWALPDEAIPRQIWREKVEGLWKSPFLGQWKINREDILLARTWQPRLWEATALLMADYLYDQIGPQELQHVAKQLPTAPSWDRIFYPRTLRYTTSLEDEMRLGNPPKMTAHNINALPLTVTVLDMDPESGQLEVEVTGQGRRLSIKSADSILKAPERAIFSGYCAMLHKEVTITEGDWLEVGKTLQARQIVVSDSSPTILPQETTLAPPDTLAYLTELGGESERGFNRFLALSEDGSITDLMTLPSLMSAGWHTQSKIPWPARLLLTLSVPNCEETWLLMYDPQQGIVDRWLTSFSSAFSGSFLDSFSGSSILPGYVWRPQEGDFILTGPTPYGNGSHSSQKNEYWSASPGEPLRLLGEVENWPHVLGWLGERMVTLDEKRKNVNIIDLKMGEVSKSIELASEYVRFFMLSEDGKHLFYSYGLPPAEKSTLHVLNLENSEDKFLFSASDGEWLSPVGGASTDHLLLLVGPETDGLPIATQQLLLVDLNASESPTLVMEIAPMQYVTSALACENERVLMTIYDRGLTEVRMWQPDGNTKSLLRTDKELTLLSCP